MSHRVSVTRGGGGGGVGTGDVQRSKTSVQRRRLTLPHRHRFIGSRRSLRYEGKKKRSPNQTRILFRHLLVIDAERFPARRSKISEVCAINCLVVFFFSTAVGSSVGYPGKIDGERSMSPMELNMWTRRLMLSAFRRERQKKMSSPGDGAASPSHRRSTNK